MYLKSLSVKNFKKFKDFSVDFPSDITIVKGPNEQGKSTILLAILAGLFYDPKKSNKDIEALKSWNSDDLYEIKMEIENEGNEISLEKNFQKKEMLLVNKTTQEEINTYKEISDYLFEIGALRSLPLFESTACVKHDALSLITQGKREISQALQSILTSSSENVSADKVIKKINGILTDLQKGLKQASKTPGQLKELEEKISELKAKKEKIIQDLQDIAKKSNYLWSLREKYSKLKKEHDAKSRQYENNLKYFEVVDELDKLNEAFKKVDSDIQKIEDIEKKIEYIILKLEKMKPLKGFNFKDFYKKLKKAEGLHAKIEYLKKHQEASKKEKKSDKKTFSFVLAVFGFAFLILGGALGFLFNEIFYAGIAFGFLFLAFAFLGKNKGKSKKDQKQNSELKKLERELDLLVGHINAVFSENEVKNEEELMKKIETYNDFCKELDKLKSKQEGILRGQTSKELKEERRELLKNIGILEEKISKEQKVNAPTPQEQRLLEIDLEKMSDELEKLKDEIVRVSAVSNQYNTSNEDLVEVEEKIAFLQEKKENLQKKVLMLEALSESLQSAQANIISKSKACIEDYMKKYIFAITDGRYDNVKVNDDLSFEVFSSEKQGMVVPEEHLSQGTIDQFYLVARFAILDILNKGKKSLVLLDDPFHSFDAKRRENTKRVLMDLSDKFQIILFTHSSDYDSWGEVVKI